MPIPEKLSPDSCKYKNQISYININTLFIVGRNFKTEGLIYGRGDQMPGTKGINFETYFCNLNANFSQKKFQLPNCHRMIN